MNCPLVSIIVPVYNASQYISECIESVLELSATNWELLLVDDGSNDNSADICKRYAHKDSRIKYYYQQNAGVSFARNTGTRYARGSWITFLDADDCLTSDILKVLDTVDGWQELVIVGYTRENRNQLFIPENHLLNSTDVQQSILNIKKFQKAHNEIYVIDEYNNWSCWGRFFRTSIIKENHILFPPGLKRSEDLLFCLKYTNYIKNVLVNETKGYYYRWNSESVTHKFADDLEKNNLRVIKAAFKLVNYEQLKSELYTFIINNLMYCCVDYYLHPQNLLSEKEKAYRLREMSKNTEIKLAIEHCNYRDIACGKRNTLRNIVLLWCLRRNLYKGALDILKILK